MKSCEIFDIEDRLMRCPFCNVAFGIKQRTSKAIEATVGRVMSHLETHHHPTTEITNDRPPTCGVPFLSMRMDHNGGN